MIVGNDVSEWQGQIDWAKYKNNTNFVIMRSSFGLNYIDRWFANNRTQARFQNIPLGYYHFAKPDLGNSAEAEAKFFCSLIDGDPIKEGECIFLDFEVDYQDAVNWCKTWLDYVSAHYNGMKPLIYLDQSRAGLYDWTPVVNSGYGLWIANYTYDPNIYSAKIGKFQFAAFQQWENNETVPGINGYVDADEFFGDVNAFKAYGYKAPVIVPPTPTPTPTPPPVTPQPTPAPTPAPNPSPTPAPVSVVDYKSYLINIRDLAYAKRKVWQVWDTLSKIKQVLAKAAV